MNKFHRADGWYDTQVRDEVLMMHNETGRFVSLNESAAAVWAALQEPRTIDDLVSILLERFDVAEATARSDVMDCLADLEKHGTIIAKGS